MISTCERRDRQLFGCARDLARHILKIVRDPATHVLFLVQYCQLLVQRLLPQMWVGLRELYGDLTDQEHQQLIALLKKVGVRLDAVMAPQGSEPPAAERFAAEQPP